MFPKRQAIRRRKKGSTEKIGNIPTLCALGHSHRSKLESSVCQVLQLRQKAGELILEQIEDHVYLTLARIGYIPDFRCRDTKTGAVFWVEAKGYPNDTWPIKKKLWRFYGPGPLEIWMGSHLNPTLSEVIIPQTKQED